MKQFYWNLLLVTIILNILIQSIHTSHKIDEVKSQLDSSVLVRDEMMIIAMNRANALWNGWVASDSILNMYFGRPPGRWVAEFKSDSLEVIFQRHMQQFHKLKIRGKK